MRDNSTGLSVVLGGLLTAWQSRLGAGDLRSYLAIGGFQGLERAAAMDQSQIMAELRAAGPRHRGAEAEPLFLSWRRAMDLGRPSLLVVDAVDLDPACQRAAHLLSSNPFGLVEALLIAAQALGARRAELLLPVGLAGGDIAVQNALDQTSQAGHDHGLALALTTRREQKPALIAGPRARAEALALDVESWLHLALVMNLGAGRYRQGGLDDQAGSWLLDLQGPLQRPGLAEAPLGGRLWAAVETLAGGLNKGAKPLAIALDGGLGGFLPMALAQTPLDPEALAGLGLRPSPGSLLVLEQGCCVIDQTRHVLAQHWRLGDGLPAEARALIAKAARMVGEFCLGRAGQAYLPRLEQLAAEMAGQGLAAAWPLQSALRHFGPDWLAHAQSGHCPAGQCFQKPVAPCQNRCPAGIDIPSFLALIGHGQSQKAVGVITMDNPLPMACGLVCPAPCEEACLRGQLDEPVFIRAMKAVAAGHAMGQGGYRPPRAKKPSGRKVAVVGSGPAGLSAAYYLALMGHDVTIFEAQRHAGGMMRYGIPAYRLPRETLAAEIEQIAKLGVKIILERKIEDMAELDDMGFDACFLGLGAQLSHFMPVEGMDAPFVHGGIDFLKDVCNDRTPILGSRVVIIGGGNTAIDCARTCWRLGAEEVTIIYRRSRAEMPANDIEVEESEREGIRFQFLANPTRIVCQPGQPNVLEFVRMELGEPDASGRRRPQAVAGSETRIQVDTVIAAIGQYPDLACVSQGARIDVNRGLVCADDQTLATAQKGVFAGGDVVHGPRTVVEAVRDGKRAAHGIDAYLKGARLDQRPLTPRARAQVAPLTSTAGQRANQRRAHMAEMAIAQRQGSFCQAELGLSDAQALSEAQRCLRCDICIGCGLCQLACSEVGAEALRLTPTSAGRLAFTDFTRPAQRCIGCGSCANVCPSGAIGLIDTADGQRLISFTGTILRAHQLTPCPQCGKPHAPQALLDHVAKRLGQHPALPDVSGLCPQCARLAKAKDLAGYPFGGGQAVNSE